MTQLPIPDVCYADVPWLAGECSALPFFLELQRGVPGGENGQILAPPFGKSVSVHRLVECGSIRPALDREDCRVIQRFEAEDGFH